MSERQLYSLAAEQSVLGALLLNNDAYDGIGDILAEKDFWAHTHRVMYRHIAGLLSAGKQCDATTLLDSLNAANDVERAGGIEYIGKVLMAVPSSSGIKQYARNVIDHRIERDLAAAAAQMDELARDAGPVADRLDEAQKLILRLTEAASSDDPVEVTEILPVWINQLEARIERGGELSGLASGLTDLDEKLSGFQDTDLIIVAGRPGMGKTTLGMQASRHTSIVEDKTALVFSMEMGKEQLVQLSVAAIGRVSSTALRAGKIVGDQWERISAAVGRMHHKKLIIDDTPGLSVEQIRARARRVKRKHGLDVIVIDYIQLMSGQGDNPNERISSISRGLKNLAKELKVPVIALSQLSRKCEERTDKRPVMSDLRDSGALEQDADVIIFVYRDEVYNPNSEHKGMAELIVAKHRMGEIGTIRTTWIGEYNTFENFTGAIPDRQPEKRPSRRGTFE